MADEFDSELGNGGRREGSIGREGGEVCGGELLGMTVLGNSW